jgi:hypothetical protein
MSHSREKMKDSKINVILPFDKSNAIETHDYSLYTSFSNYPFSLLAAGSYMERNKYEELVKIIFSSS